MADAARDQNYVPTLTGVLNTDGTTIKRVTVDPTNHTIDVDDNTTGSDLVDPERALRDANFVPVLIGVSSADGTTAIPVYVLSNGKLAIKST